MDKFKLYGYINMLGILPDFMYPVYKNGDEFYLAHGNRLFIENFHELKASCIAKIVELPEMYQVIECRTGSEQVYVYSTLEKKVLIGRGYEIKKQLMDLQIEEEVLQKDVNQFVEKFRKIDIMEITDRRFYGTGRRKKAVARVYLSFGTGEIRINKRSLEEYFGMPVLQQTVRQPLRITGTEFSFDLYIHVHGGGTSGQAGAIRHGIARALLQVDAEYRKVLKHAGVLTRDPRMKERKKYGLKAARRAAQFSKR